MSSRGPLSIDELAPKPRNDAFTALLAVSLLAMILACVLLWYNLKDFGGSLDPKKADAERINIPPPATTPLTPPGVAPPGHQPGQP